MRISLLIVSGLAIATSFYVCVFFQSSWAEDEAEAAKHALEQQRELAKQQMEAQKELFGDDDDDDRGLGLSFGRMNLANIVLLGTVASIAGVGGYAGYKVLSIKRKAAAIKRKPTS